MTAAVCLFRGLADPARLTILRHLALGEHRVVDLTAHVGLAQSTVSGHLACLRDCGLVVARTQGRSSLYSLARPELHHLLAAAERLLGAPSGRINERSSINVAAIKENATEEPHARWVLSGRCTAWPINPRPNRANTRYHTAWLEAPSLRQRHTPNATDPTATTISAKNHTNSCCDAPSAGMPHHGESTGFSVSA